MKNPLKIDEVITKLKTHNIRITMQRTLISKLMLKSETPLNGFELYTKARQTFPNLSRATIYNIIRDFQAADLLVEIAYQNQIYYDLKNKAISYSICDKCQTIHRINPSQISIGLDKHAVKLNNPIIIFGFCDLSQK